MIIPNLHESQLEPRLGTGSQRVYFRTFSPIVLLKYRTPEGGEGHGEVQHIIWRAGGVTSFFYIYELVFYLE